MYSYRTQLGKGTRDEGASCAENRFYEYIGMIKGGKKEGKGPFGGKSEKLK